MLATLERVGVAAVARERWSDLLEAERARVALAQALVHCPRLLIVDEPLLGLDLLERERLMALLRELAEQSGVGVLLATLSLSAMLGVHEMRALADGRLIGPRASQTGTLIEFPKRESA